MYLDSYVYPNANYGYEVIQRVPNVDAVSACRVPLDGRVSYFVLNDNSAICTKFIDMNSKAVIRKYVLQETPSNNKTIEERIANLESIVAQMKGADVNVSTAANESPAGDVQPVAENRFAQQQCCCETNRNIDSVKAENYQNTCTITSAIHEEAEKTRALITANTMQELRDKLAEKDRELQAAQFNVGQCAQTAMIVNQLRPFPQPAYTVANPYATPTATT